MRAAFIPRSYETHPTTRIHTYETQGSQQIFVFYPGFIRPACCAVSNFGEGEAAIQEYRSLPGKLRGTLKRLGAEAVSPLIIR
jgi:hypothetical protein